MPFNNKMIDELNLLIKFDINNSQQGLKVGSSASPEMVAAVESLFEKGLVTEKDGGYLTNLGIDAAEHAQTMISILTSRPEHTPE
ncbi:TIGR02647 family protein [Vibrio sp. SS-MA-C1-2]|uniref:TIGR02647 family protein n=1 Tax=Vibrio sp. SS-MA-C1-2 TaxID=2908646 RepID=UPI001F3BDDDC|nr:TIGR02647 family protein [Vibrio sp. SS-MA-C1-2]UJF19841.1 TIGR02647 family protein [Vibrio sp. SS-MA-C1-2]